KAKNFSSALTSFQKAHELATAAGDEATQKRSAKNGGVAAYMHGVQESKADKAQAALAAFDAGIALAPTFYANYIGRASALKDAGDVETAMQAYIKAAEVSQRAGKMDKRNEMYEQAEGFSARAIAAEDWNQAIEYGNMYLALNPESSDVEYHLAVAYSNLGNDASALEHADKAIALSKGSRSTKAPYFMIKAESLENMQRFEEAVAAYREANVGQYAARAAYKIETLGGTQ
ncbi:MAG: hypothetical protein AAF752_13185, partial [Bacteroidota bacterium]